MNEAEQRELLATACHILYKLGLSDYLGHPSVRLDADRILIKPKHSPKVRGMDRMRPEDMSVVDLDGKLLLSANLRERPWRDPRAWGQLLVAPLLDVLRTVAFPLSVLI